MGGLFSDLDISTALSPGSTGYDDSSLNWFDPKTIANPHGEMYRHGYIGLGGTPTDLGVENAPPWTSKDLNELANNYGMDTAIAIALGGYMYGQGGFGFGDTGMGGVSGGETGMGGGFDPYGMTETQAVGSGGLDAAGAGGTAPAADWGGDAASGWEGNTAEAQSPYATNTDEAIRQAAAAPSDTGAGNTTGNVSRVSGMPNTWQGWAKSVGPASVMGALQLYGNYRNNSAAADRAKKAQDAYNARQAQNDNPPPNPYLGKISPMSRNLSEDPLSYLTYGQRPEHQFYKAAKSGGAIDFLHGRHNALPSPHGGGLDMAMVNGHGGGQEDNVPAMLSPKEYVLDAETVSNIGDGNPDEGARRLDHFRSNLRRHKRSAPASRIPPKARPIESYMRKAA